MATATLRGDKTKFVNDFLAKNPQGNLRAVNEAWAAEGMRDTISKSVVDKTRAKLGLTGNLGAKSGTAAKQKAAPNKPRTATATPGKSSFVKEFLHDHPEVTAREVNVAWTAAGMKGTISHTVVSEVRKELGLIGTQTVKTSKPAKKTPPPRSPNPPRRRLPPSSSSQPRPLPAGRCSSRCFSTTILKATSWT